MRTLLSALTALALFSGPLFAQYDNYESCNSCQYGCPAGPLNSLNNNCGFYVGGTWIYAVPTGNGLGTITDSWQYAIPGGTISKSKVSKAHYKSAYSVLVGYDFPCSANNLEVEYTHLYNSKHNYFTSAGAESFGSILFNVQELFPPPLVSDSHLKYRFNQVDVTGGHRFITASGCLQLHPFLGVRYANLHHALPFAIGNTKSKYWGAGPLAGIDVFYEFCNGLGLVGKADGSLLMGSTKSTSQVTVLGFTAKNLSPSQNRVVPAFGGRLGLAYNYFFCNRSRIKLEVGYQANIFIDPFDVITAFFPFDQFQRISNIQSSDFAYSGPYINLTWHI